MVEKTRNRNSNNAWSKICTRLVHVVITVSIAVVLLVKDTILREHFKNHSYLLPVSFIVAVVLSMVLYFTVACMDPGYVKREDYDVEEIRLILDDEDASGMPLYEINNITDNLDLELNDSQQLLHRNEKMSEKTKILGSDDKSYHFNLDANQRCGLCGLQRPLRAKHCRECKHCVRKFDHHCPWITNCVGERNHRFFWIFLFFELFLLCWGMYISTTGFAHKKVQTEWISQNLLLLFVDIMLGILILVVVTLLGIHTYLLVANQTTWEQMSRNRISYLKNLGEMENPFHLGMCGNVYSFFCHFKPYDWNVVYSKAKKHERVERFEESDSDKETEFCEINIENN